MAWRIEYTESAEADLRRLDRHAAKRIRDYLRQRVGSSEDPRLRGKALGGPLTKLWSYRVGDFRVICDIQDNVLRVLVVRVGRRDQVYR